MLGLKPRRRAELSADQSGTLMHWVLQMALDPHPGADNPCAGLRPFLELDDAAMADLAAALVDEYARRYLPEDTARFAYLLSRLKKSMTSLLCYLRDEQNQSQFKPVACELKIGRGEDAVPGQVYRLSDGRTVQLVGTVDRADEWIEDDGTRWVRVVDYKTGTKKFSLTDVLTGEECQMLLYLFTLTARWPLLKGHAGEFQEVEYLMVDPAPKDEGRAKAMKEGGGLVYEKQGMILEREGEEEPPLTPEKQAAMKKASATESQQEAWRKGNHRVTLHRKQLENIEAYLQELIVSMAKRLYAGQITACPRQNKQGMTGCKAWCPYRSVCGHVDGEHERERPEEKKDLFMEKENVEWDN